MILLRTWASKGLRIASCSGQGILEPIVAAGVISVSALGLGYAIKVLGESRERTSLVNRSVALESSLVSAMGDAVNFPENVKSNLRSGSLPPSFELRVEVPAANQGYSSFVLRMGQTTQVCWSRARGQFEILADALEQNCTEDIYRIKVDLKRINAGGDSASGFAFAYFLAAESQKVVGLKAVGAKSADFQYPEDFQTLVPAELYRTWDEQSCRENELLMRGVDRDSGQPICMTVDSSPCPDGRFATGLIVVAGVLKLNCSGSTRAISCSQAGFSLQSLNPQSLISGRVQGQCVYASQNSEVLPPIAGVELRGRVCPQNYRASSATVCQVKTQSQSRGLCRSQNIIASAPQLGPRELHPDGSGRICTRRTISYSYGADQPSEPRPGVLIRNQISEADVDCEIQVPEQDCGATWIGQAELTGACEIAITPTIPAIGVD